MDTVDFASTNGQILHVLRVSGKAMNANQIYSAGSFEYEHQCYNGLANLSKKGILQREKVNGLYHYTIAPDAPIDETLAEELKELAVTGLPAPDPNRRVGLSREEYTTLPKAEKETLRRTRSVVHRETSITEVEESNPTIERTPQVVAEKPKALQPPAPPKAPQPQVALLADLRAQRVALDREIAMAEIMADLTSGGEHLAFMLGDYVELLQLSIDCMDDDDAKPLVANQHKARAFMELLKTAGGGDSVFKRAGRLLLEWAEICEDCAAGDASDTGDRSRKDAAECKTLAAMFGCARKTKK